MNDSIIYAKEYWTGDSRDGVLINGEGYHFFKMKKSGLIVEAFEVYESDDGDEVATPLSEMENINWIEDLGFDNLDILDLIDEQEYKRIKNFNKSS